MSLELVWALCITAVAAVIFAAGHRAGYKAGQSDYEKLLR